MPARVGHRCMSRLESGQCHKCQQPDSFFPSRRMTHVVSVRYTRGSKGELQTNRGSAPIEGQGDHPRHAVGKPENQPGETFHLIKHSAVGDHSRGQPGGAIAVLPNPPRRARGTTRHSVGRRHEQRRYLHGNAAGRAVGASLSLACTARKSGVRRRIARPEATPRIRSTGNGPSSARAGTAPRSPESTSTDAAQAGTAKAISGSRLSVRPRALPSRCGGARRAGQPVAEHPGSSPGAPQCFAAEQ